MLSYSAGLIRGIKYTKSNMAVQCETYQTEGGGGGGGGLPHCFTSLLSPQCGHRELQMKSKCPRCSPELGAMVTKDWCINKQCKP